MHRFRQILFRLQPFFRRRKIEAGLSEELRTHLDMATEANIVAGMSPEEAQHAAQRDFGGTDKAKELYRDERGIRWVENFLRDLLFVVRTLRKNPGFMLAVVATLAIGIGATTAMIVIVWQGLFPTLPFAHEERVVVIDEFDRQRNTSMVEFASRYVQIRSSSNSFAKIAAQGAEQMNLVVNGDPEALISAWVTPEFFAVFGVNAACGRTFYAEEHVTGGASGAVVVLSHGVWLQRFGGDTAVIGREINLGGRLRRVVGVMPERFLAPPGFASWGLFLPLAEDELVKAGAWSRVWMAGRLKPGVLPGEAGAEISALGMPTPGSPNLWNHLDPQVIPIRDKYRPETARLFWVFLGAAAFLHSIAIVNALNLALMRIVSRRRELAVRIALGGNRVQVGRLLLLESLLLCALAGAAGLGIAHGAINLLGGVAADSLPGERPAFSSFSGEIWMVATVCAVVTGLALAVVPAWRVGRTSVQDALKEGAGSLGDSRRLQRLRSMFVVLQTALTVALLAGGGVTMRSYVALQRAGFGFDPSGKLAVDGALETGAIPVDPYLDLASRAVEEIGRVSGVRTVALAENLPLSNWIGDCQVRAAERPEAPLINCSCNKVSPEYFNLLGLPVLAGRGFVGFKRGDAPVVIVNETLARKAFPGENPLGRRLEMPGMPAAEIVGVVADTRERGARAEALPQTFVPFWQRNGDGTSWLTILVRVEGGQSAGLNAAIRRAAFAVEPRWTMHVRPLDDYAKDTVRVERTTTVLLEVFAMLSLGLAAMGLFAVMAYSVAQRRREFGLRIALGAGPGAVQRLVLGRGLALAAIGLLVGLGAAAGLTRFLRSVLFETGPCDPAIYIAVAAGLLVVALLACWLPAQRAAQVDPAEALRAE
jgi:putative ABC transport system permease protein